MLACSPVAFPPALLPFSCLLAVHQAESSAPPRSVISSRQLDAHAGLPFSITPGRQPSNSSRARMQQLLRWSHQKNATPIIPVRTGPRARNPLAPPRASDRPSELHRSGKRNRKHRRSRAGRQAWAAERIRSCVPTRPFDASNRACPLRAAHGRERPGRWEKDRCRRRVATHGLRCQAPSTRAESGPGCLRACGPLIPPDPG